MKAEEGEWWGKNGGNLGSKHLQVESEEGAVLWD